MTILIVEDDRFNREGIRMFLEQLDYAVLEAGDAETAWQYVQTNPLQAVILDIVLPPSPNVKVDFQASVGIQFAERVKASHPALGIVIFSAHEDRGSAVFNMVCDGVRGLAYKLKGCTPTTLVEAIRGVERGQVIIDAQVTSLQHLSQRLENHLTAEERPLVKAICDKLTTLSPREQDVAYCLAASHSRVGIEKILQITKKTVESHITQIYKKTGLNQINSQFNQTVLLAKACMLKDLERR